MIDMDLIRGKFSFLAECLGRLEHLAAMGAEDVLSNGLACSGLRYDLIVAVECMIDAGQHIIADEGWLAPDRYADVPIRLGEHGVIGTDLAERLAEAARLRNRVVHLYESVDDRALHRGLADNINDLRAFTTSVSRWLQANG